MRSLTSHEAYFRQIVWILGIGLLIFLLFLTVMSGAVSLLTALLAFLPLSEIAATVIYQLVYGGLYLAVFLCPIPFMRMMMRGKRLPWRPVRSTQAVSGYLPLIVLGGITAILAQSYINAGLVSFLQFDSLFEDLLPSINGETSNLDLLLSFLVLAVVPAFAEELLFRGAIMGNLLPFGSGTAILVSALAFGLMHQNPAQFLYAFCAGLLLGVIYERTGSIWNCVILHLLNNASSLLSTVFVRRFGEEGGSVAMLIADAILILLGLTSIVLLTKRVSKPLDVQNGAFERALPVSASYAAYPLSPSRSVQILIASPFGVFLIFCIVSGIAVAGMMLMMGVLA